MRLVLVDRCEQARRNFYPLSLSRPIWELRCGFGTLAEKLIGKHAVFKTKTGNEIKGIITKAHGGNGAVLARFDHGGLPGQSLGKEITIQ